MKFKPVYLIGIFLAIVLLAANFYLFYGSRWFAAGIILCITIGWTLPWIDFLSESKRQKEIEFYFLEFTRNLVESIKSGISIPRSILHVSNKDYGALTPFVRKLSGQIELGIPVRKALVTFANDTENNIIIRAVSIVNEAERSGGDIRDVLDSIVDSVFNVKKLKLERKASVFSQIVQGYIVFFVFIGIMLILQLWLFPKLTGLSTSIDSGVGGITIKDSGLDFDKIFFALILIQGFFAGIMIGKFSEGTLKQGLIHSLILMTSAALIVTTAKGGI
ncbi:MAG TPA: type II secretion system F family protein [Candidatus Nanoarchaeia archaeon]|nr:type II secretion system F family protein [Candidatus Nanoarchaeia archaeon]